jgi:uncharacterized membrane protein
MVSALLAANTALIVELMRERGMSPIQVIYLLAVPTNVLTLGAGVMYGLKDAFVAALLMVAVIFRHRRYVLTAGVLVGLAALTKYYRFCYCRFSRSMEGAAALVCDRWRNRGLLHRRDR